MKERSIMAAVAATTFVLGAATVMAQPGEEDPLATESPSSSNTVPADNATAGAAKWGIATVFPTGGDTVFVDFLAALSADNWLNLSLSFTIDKTIGTDDTIVGIGAFGGYRMYRAMAGRIRPYIEPYGGIAIADFDNAGDSLLLTFGGRLGVDFMLFDQFTLGSALGLGATFEDDFDTIHIGPYTTSIIATFWW